jgi:hypothetical protein
MGGDSFADKAVSPLGATDMFLVRIDAADTDAGTQTFDLWVNPDPANLGAPDASVVWPAAIRSWNIVQYSLVGGTVDELRIDSSMSNVVNIPAPGAAAIIPAIVIAARRRRRMT